MDNFGLDKKGFRRKLYPDIKQSMQDRAREVFGEDINVADNSFLGMLITVTSWCVSRLWQLAEKVYYNKYVDFAEGVNLDLACRNNGVTRLGALPSTGTATFSESVPSGVLISAGSIVFKTVEAGTTVGIEAVESGKAGNLPANAINRIVTPLPAVDLVSVTETVGGRDIETDSELRSRFFESLATAGAGTLNSIKSALLRTDGVKSATVEEVPEGDYYKGIRAIVWGGAEDDIAQAIFDHKAFGIKTLGSESGTAVADNEDTFTIKFDYATEQNVNIVVTVTPDSRYPANGDTLVKELVEEYIDGLSMGEDLIHSNIVARVLTVVGVADVVVKINGQSGNLAIDYDKVVKGVVTVQ